MSDKVKQVAERILERTKDQIGTHSTNCHEYHLECFAVFVLRHLEAAQSDLVVESRETLVSGVLKELVNARNFPEKVQSRILGQNMKPLAMTVGDALLASGTVRLAADDE